MLKIKFKKFFERVEHISDCKATVCYKNYRQLQEIEIYQGKEVATKERYIHTIKIDLFFLIIMIKFKQDKNVGFFIEKNKKQQNNE